MAIVIQKIPNENKIILMESDNSRAAFRYTIIHLSNGKSCFRDIILNSTKIAVIIKYLCGQTGL